LGQSSPQITVWQHEQVMSLPVLQLLNFEHYKIVKLSDTPPMLQQIAVCAAQQPIAGFASPI